MAVGMIDTQNLEDIADAIRSKSGSSDTFKPSEMAQGILDIPSGGITPTGTVNITTNGTHDVTNYASANVNVPSQSPSLGTKAITQNGTYTASDDSLDGYSSVTVNVGGASLDLQLVQLGEWSFEKEAWTSTTADTLNTGFYFVNETTYLYYICTVECDGELDTSNANNWGGLTIMLGTRYQQGRASNAGRYFAGATIMFRGVTRPMRYSDTSGASDPVNVTSYGVYVSSASNQLSIQRKAHATNCPVIMGGTYQVRLYAITAV